MKKVLPLFALLVIQTTLSLCAQTAVVHLICLSPEVLPATTTQPFTGLDWSLSVSSLGDPNNPNNEMEWAPPDINFSHVGNFFLTDPTTFTPAPLAFVLDVPPFADANGNGIYDFFDPAVEVANAKTQGLRQNEPGGSSAVDFTATWNRAAGASSGTVAFDFPDLGLTFTHDFNLVRYEGEMNYSRASNIVNGTIALTNFTSAEDTISGPVSLDVSDQDSLQYQGGVWDAPNGFTYTFTPVDTLDRVRLNYVALLEFADGNSATGPADYRDWLWIVSSSDSNTNGIADLVEAISSPPPSLQVIKTPAGIELQVFGTVGQSYFLEAADALAGSTGIAWQTIQTISLTASPQSIPLPATAAAQFFRLRQGP